MRFAETELPGVFRIEPQVIEDQRGFFMEVWRADTFREAGIDVTFVQQNVSRSVRTNTLRGLHYQIEQPQGKLVRVTEGEIFDVAVDLRKSSPSYLQNVGVRLSADNRASLWVPPGFAHGFLVVSEVAEIEYKCTDYYAPEYDRTIRWDDPELAIDWPLSPGLPPVLSAKDASAPFLSEAETYP